VAARFGCVVTRTKVGEANVAEEMRRQHAVIGGEGNGGVIYPRVNFARDSLVGIALILNLLAESTRSMSELVDELPQCEMVKLQFACPSHRITHVLKQIRSEYGHFPMDLRDGVKVCLPEGWFHLRGSNTEPVLRLVAEAKTDEEVKHIATSVSEKMKAWL
jgi:phosphomannomutase